MTKPTSDARKIRAIWILRGVGGSYFEYRGLAGSLDTRGETLVFTLHETSGEDEDFEILLRKDPDGWRLRSDAIDETEGLLFQDFGGADEIILAHESLSQAIYLHLPKGLTQ